MIRNHNYVWHCSDLIWSSNRDLCVILTRSQKKLWHTCLDFCASLHLDGLIHSTVAGLKGFKPVWMTFCRLSCSSLCLFYYLHLWRSIYNSLVFIAGFNRTAEFWASFGSYLLDLLVPVIAVSCHGGWSSRPDWPVTIHWLFLPPNNSDCVKRNRGEFGLFVVTMPAHSRPSARCFDFREQSPFAIKREPFLLGLAASLFPNYWKSWTRSNMFSWSLRVYIVLRVKSGQNNVAHILFIM